MNQKKVVVFGTETFASLAWYCLTQDSPYEVVAFTVDRDYLKASIHHDLPVVAFEDLIFTFPPDSVRILIPVGYHAINSLRRQRYEWAQRQGYEFVTYVSSRAITWPDLRIGQNGIVYEAAIIQPFSSIGNNVIIRSAAHISHHCYIADHVFISACVALGGNVYIGEQSFIGVGAVVRDGLRIAERSFIAAGAVVVEDTQSDCVYLGNPARKILKSALEVTTAQ
jgi:sugar O-acyltransferase (sialic acid O-acetyltransferase NeuD family)